MELYRRLYASPNRIHWRAEDVKRLAAHYGVADAQLAGIAPPPQSRDVPAWPAKASAGGRSYTFTISTAGVDRLGDSVSVAGWRLGNFAKNPVVLFAHDSSSLPIGKGRVWTDGAKLKGAVQFSANGAAVEELVKDGVLRATSVGFIPGTWELSRDPARKGGINFLEGHELLEFSIVPVPANAEATLDAGQLKALTPDQKRRGRELELLRLRLGP
jgi:HK97 family phage prohead protease